MFHVLVLSPLPCSYYINRDQDIEQRRRVEAWWSHVWDLRRHAQVSGLIDETRISLLGKEHDEELLRSISEGAFLLHSVMRQETLSTLESWIKLWLGPTLSHLTAIRRAYDGGDNMAMIMEDSVTPYLVPFWLMGIKDLVAFMSSQPWHILQLSRARCRELPVGHPWRDHIKLRGPDSEGAAAYVISRAGMEQVVEKYFRADGSIRLPLARGRVTPANEILAHMPLTYVVSPPLLATDFGATVFPPGVQGNALKKQNQQAWGKASLKLTKWLKDGAWEEVVEPLG